MGDVRFERAYDRVQAAHDAVATLRAMTTDELIMALASTGSARDPLLVNVMATELQNRARRTLAIAEHIGEAVATVDSTGRLTYLNPTAKRMLGVGDEVIGQHGSEAVRFVDATGREVPWNERSTRIALTGERAERSDLWVEGANGERIPVSVVSTPIVVDGEVVGAVASMRDVEEQRRLEEDLRMHKRLLDAIGEAVVATKPDGTILYWNAAAERTYGWRAEEVTGRDIMEVTPTQASRAQGEEIMERLGRGEAWSGTFPTQRRDGTVFLACVTNRPVLDDAGKLVAIIGVSRPEDGPGG